MGAEGANDGGGGGKDGDGTGVAGGGGKNPPENAAVPRCRGRDEIAGAICLVAVLASRAARDGGMSGTVEAGTVAGSAGEEEAEAPGSVMAAADERGATAKGGRRLG
jgi:hypothetical protein